MEDCDAVLARMQEMLLGFQADLGGISDEIRHLQDESLSMSIRLKNRRGAEELLHKFLDNAAIKPDFAQNITDDNINEVFLESVMDLSKKLKYFDHNEPPRDGSCMDMLPCDTFAGRMLLPDLERMKHRAIIKIKEYFTVQFAAIRKPKTNVQMLQQTGLVKFSALFTFLHDEAFSVAEDIRSMYVEAMGRTLYSLFKNYLVQLLKLEAVVASKLDTIAVEDAALRSMFTQKVNLNKRSDAFALGDRDKILEHVEAEPILVHVCLAEGQKHPFEALLRSLIKHLIDSATNEFLFVIDFFKSQPRDTFNR